MAEYAPSPGCALSSGSTGGEQYGEQSTSPPRKVTFIRVRSSRPVLLRSLPRDSPTRRTSCLPWRPDFVGVSLAIAPASTLTPPTIISACESVCRVLEALSCLSRFTAAAILVAVRFERGIRALLRERVADPGGQPPPTCVSGNTGTPVAVMQGGAGHDGVPMSSSRAKRLPHHCRTRKPSTMKGRGRRRRRSSPPNFARTDRGDRRPPLARTGL